MKHSSALAKKHVHRSCKGAMVGIGLNVILIPTLMWICMALVDLGVADSHQLRLDFVVRQAANYAVNVCETEDVELATTKMVKRLLQINGLTPTHVDVTVKQVVQDNRDAMLVELKGDFALLQVHDVPLPLTIPLTSSTTLTLAPNRIGAGIALSPESLCTQHCDPVAVYVPIVRPKQASPVWEFAYGDSGMITNVPYDVTLHDLEIVDRKVPDLKSTADNQLIAHRPSLY